MNDTELSRVNLKNIRDALRGAFSYLPAYNAVNNAYHYSGMSWFVPPRSLRWRLPAWLIPKKVRRFVDPDPVVGGLWKSLRAARALIERERLSLDREVEQPIPSGGQSYDNLPANLVFSHKTMIGGGRAVSYTFNLYQVVLAMIDEYEHFLTDVMVSSIPPVAQLSHICQKAKSLETRVNLVTEAMS